MSNPRPIVRSDGKRYPSMKAALEDMGLDQKNGSNRSNLSRACSSGCLFHGYGFEYEDGGRRRPRERGADPPERLKPKPISCKTEDLAAAMKRRRELMFY